MNISAVGHANSAALTARTASAHLGSGSDQEGISHFGLAQLAAAVEELAHAVAALGEAQE